jgi:iron-sulfur cluster repair protein YtfE (RIC family)
MPDVIKVLEQDHREVEELFASAESISGAAREQTVGKIISELKLHMQVEEQYVYPAMREAGLSDLVQEAEQEHSKAKELVTQLEGMDTSTNDIDSLLQQLKGEIDHHVQEEEHEAFPKFREACDQATLQDLAEQVRAAKEGAQPD